MKIKAVLGRARSYLPLFGLHPTSLRHLRHGKRYFRDAREFRRQGGKITIYRPILEDYADQSGVASGHYFHQDLLVAQFIHDAAPVNHVDIASRIDGFVAHVAAFRQIDVIDIRPLRSTAHPNILFVQADLMQPLQEFHGRYSSVSCLHALEHFGLGRYTDTIAVDGHLAGFEAVLSLVAPGGALYVSFPVGRARVEFNAHRVFDPAEILGWAGDRAKLERFDFVDDRGDLHKQAHMSDAAGQDYACGIYTLRKAMR